MSHDAEHQRVEAPVPPDGAPARGLDCVRLDSGCNQPFIYLRLRLLTGTTVGQLGLTTHWF